MRAFRFDRPNQNAEKTEAPQVTALILLDKPSFLIRDRILEKSLIWLDGLHIGGN
jgi:hypothetical protein